MRRKTFIGVPMFTSAPIPNLWNFDLPEQNPPNTLQASPVLNRSRKEDLIADEKGMFSFQYKLHKKAQAHSKVPVESFI